MNEIDIVYIAGESRSGTTIVDRILGTLPGVTSLCELRYVWTSGFQYNHVCSCGTHFADCEFWSAVREVLGATDEDLRGVAELEGDVIRSRHYPRFYLGLGNKAFNARVDAYRVWLGRLLRAIVEVTGTRTLIDSSKSPSGPLILAGIDGVKTSVLHVVRDPRGFVYSLQKGNLNPGYGGRMAVRAPLSALNGWIVRNLFIEQLQKRFPYYRLNYDRCMQDPPAAFDAVCAALPPLRGKEVHFDDGAKIDLPPIHTISGNPHRFRTGPTALKQDTAWRDGLAGSAQRLVNTIGYPLIRRYGF